MAQAQSGSFELRWGGQVFDLYTDDGLEVWTAEDGGRIRHRSAQGNWTFQATPPEVRDRLHRIFMLPGAAGQRTGWAVGMSGNVLKTTNSGTSWARVEQFAAVIPGNDPYEQLYSVRFLDANNGWIVGLHGIWWTDDAGASWHQATVLLDNNQTPTPTDWSEIELYELDVVPDPGGSGGGLHIIGLAAAEPGYVFRSTNGQVWTQVWDVRDHCTELLTTCAHEVCENDPNNPNEAAAIFEPWDIKISRHPTQKLALMGGGHGFQCGMMFRSTDDGTTWVQEPHECDCVVHARSLGVPHLHGSPWLAESP
jgi:hypothetical protein